LSVRGRRGNPPVLKRLGQHFLHDEQILERIANAAAPMAGDTVIEIGPGRGALTDILAKRPNRLAAIEIDKALSAQLREKYSKNANVTIIEGDVLQTDIAALAGGPYVVVGNVPYYITTPILFHVMRAPLPRHAVFLVQLEVAERIVAAPGSRTYGALSVNVQAIATAEIISQVPRSAFRPPPKVTSAIVRITPRLDAIVAGDEAIRFRSFVQGLFGMRRKQIANVIRSVSTLTTTQVAEVLQSLDIDPKARPETLSPIEQAELMRAVRKVGENQS
jgi:16S rRNA (adenine1518-N6/adenine1519-N6)-dimethyltransferase